MYSYKEGEYEWKERDSIETFVCFCGILCMLLAFFMDDNFLYIILDAFFIVVIKGIFGNFFSIAAGFAVEGVSLYGRQGGKFYE